MVQEIVSTALLNKTELSDLLIVNNFLQEERALFLGEMLPQQVVIDRQERYNLLRFEPFHLDERHTLLSDGTTMPYAEYTSGRVFNDKYELRWQAEDDKVHVVYIGEMRDISLLVVKHHLTASGKPKPYYLFGTRLNSEQLKNIGNEAREGDFAVARIPRLLHYPLSDDKKYARLIVQEYEYEDEKAERGHLFRFSGVDTINKPVEKQEQQR